MKKSLVLFIAVIFSFTTHGQNVNTGCSIWRRDVKILSDLSPQELNALLSATPQPTTLTELITPDPPDPLTNSPKWKNQPRYDSEKVLKRVTVKIVACGKEANDHDYHIVIANPADPTQTMVSEIPDPDCPDVASNAILSARYKALRDWFDTNVIRPASTIKPLETPVDVDIIGVPFWDGKHPGNVNGAAPNFHELHPILNFIKDGIYAVPN